MLPWQGHRAEIQFLGHLQPGFYCIYRRRQPGTLNYNVKNEGAYQSYENQPDCANITGILTLHAQQLTAAGIDHVVVVRTPNGTCALCPLPTAHRADVILG